MSFVEYEFRRFADNPTQLVLPSFSLCDRADARRRPPSTRSGHDFRPGCVFYVGPFQDALSILRQPAHPVDHYHVNVFLLPSSRGTVQVIGCGHSADRCCYSSSDSIHRLSNSANQDASLVQVAHLDQSSAIRIRSLDVK